MSSFEYPEIYEQVLNVLDNNVEVEYHLIEG